MRPATNKQITVPLAVWDDRSLGWREKILYAEVASYAARGKDCTLTNQQIADLLGCSYRQACRITANLLATGFVTRTAFDGRCQKWQISIDKNDKADLTKMARQHCQKCQGRLDKNVNPIPISILSSDIVISSDKDNNNLSTRDNISTRDNNISRDIKKEINKKESTPHFDFGKALRSLGISKETADAWMQVRKTKRSTNTKIAFDAVAAEIAKSGASAEDCIRFAVVQSWSGFRASWYTKAIAEQDAAQRPAGQPRRENYVEAGLRVADELLGTNYSQQLHRNGQ